MSLTEHLSADRLAAYDDAPTIEELAHLAACSACRQERAAHARVVALAVTGFLPDPELPRLVEWEAIAAGLSGRPDTNRQGPEGDPGVSGDPPVAGRQKTDSPANSGAGRWGRALRRVLAAGVLLTVGGAFERWRAFQPREGSEADRVPVAQPASGFASSEEASAALGRAYREYERAALWLAANDSTHQEPEAVRARLAALDRMLAASRLGLRAAPQDPVLNHYLLSAWAVREATLEQLGGVLPVGEFIARY